MTIQGHWKVTLLTPAGPKAATLELEANGAILTGALYDAEHHASISEGTIVGEQLAWSMQIEKPMRIRLRCKATVEGDRITGTAKYLFVSMSFSGSRA